MALRSVGRRLLLTYAWAYLAVGTLFIWMQVFGFGFAFASGEDAAGTGRHAPLLIFRLIDGEDLHVGDVIAPPFEVDRIDAAYKVMTLRPADRQVAILRDERDPTADPIPLTLDHPVRRVILSVPLSGAAAYIDGTILWPLLGLLAIVGIVVSGQSAISVRGLNRLRLPRATRSPNRRRRYVAIMRGVGT